MVNAREGESRNKDHETLPDHFRSAGENTQSASAALLARPWLRSYPPGVPFELGPPQFSSLAELFSTSCRDYAERPAFTCMGRSLSYAELGHASKAFAAYLQRRGIERGARIAIMLPNILQYPIAVAGIIQAGCTVVNVNPLYTARELELQLADSGAEAIVILENFAATLQTVIARTNIRHVIICSIGEMLGVKGTLVNFVVRRVRKLVPAWSLPGHVRFRKVLEIGRRSDFMPVTIGPNDIAFLQYTGGTTGIAKGAILLHRNIIANMMQNRIWADNSLARRPRPPNQIFVCALPLYHIFALTVNAVMGMEEGANNILIPNPRDIPRFVAELRKYNFNVFTGLNTLFKALLNNKEFHKLDFSQLRWTLAGGMPVQPVVAQTWKEATGCSVSEGYGLSETSPVVAANIIGAEVLGTIGLPLPSTEIRIRDDDGNDLPLGEVGELVIRGPQVMPGYWNQSGENERAFSVDGFFKSGDVGFMDADGFIRIVDRKKEMILVSGFNVFPSEIEEVVSEHPGVLEAAAIGVPDEHSGETIKLFIVPRDPSLTKQEIAAYCRENLTGYKRPRYIEFREELPKSNIGKILRRKLRDE